MNINELNEWEALMRKHQWKQFWKLIGQMVAIAASVAVIHVAVRSCVDTRPAPALIGTAAAEMGAAVGQ